MLKQRARQTQTFLFGVVLCWFFLHRGCRCVLATAFVFGLTQHPPKASAHSSAQRTVTAPPPELQPLQARQAAGPAQSRKHPNMTKKRGRQTQACLLLWSKASSGGSSSTAVAAASWIVLCMFEFWGCGRSCTRLSSSQDCQQRRTANVKAALQLPRFPPLQLHWRQAWVGLYSRGLSQLLPR